MVNYALTVMSYHEIRYIGHWYLILELKIYCLPVKDLSMKID